MPDEGPGDEECDFDANYWLPYRDECYANAAEHLPKLLEGIRVGAMTKDWNKWVEMHNPIHSRQNRGLLTWLSKPNRVLTLKNAPRIPHMISVRGIISELFRFSVSLHCLHERGDPLENGAYFLHALCDWVHRKVWDVEKVRA